MYRTMQKQKSVGRIVDPRKVPRAKSDVRNTRVAANRQESVVVSQPAALAKNEEKVTSNRYLKAQNLLRHWEKGYF